VPIPVPNELRKVGPARAAIDRRPGSVRRTSTIDATWPGGQGTTMVLAGRARDLLTPADGSAPRVVAEDQLHVTVAPDRTIETIRCLPPRPAIGELVGARGGGGSRGKVRDALPDEVTLGTPLYLLLDDMAGASLVSGFAFAQWQLTSSHGQDPVVFQGPKLLGTCAGYQPGASALDAEGHGTMMHDLRTVDPITRADDPWAFHEVPVITEVSARRTRRTDVWIEDGVAHIDGFFQDAYTSPLGTRLAVHEYCFEASMDPGSGELLAIRAIPRVLPMPECPLAAANVTRMIGLPVREFRTEVIRQLPGIDGCTHLNDVLRSMAEVPILVEALVAGRQA
jgi:hypothetical protein